MPRLAANLTLLFNEVEFLDRFALAAEAGFSAVECQFPYQYRPAELSDRLAQHHLTLVLHNMPSGDWERGERGIACLPDRIDEFQDGVARAIEYGRALGCTKVNCLAGVRPSTVDPEDAHHTFVRNLQYAAPRFQSAGIQLLIEPLNTRDVPGFFLSGSRQALALMNAAAPAPVMLQFDAYHLHTMGEAVLATFEQHLRRIGHVQIADAPGRHEPGTGVIPYPQFFSLIDRLGYAGWVGCEYLPASDTRAGLGWATSYFPPAARSAY